MPRLTLFIAVLIGCIFVAPAIAQEKPRTENVIVVTLDGFRFQEFFGGADETLLNKQFGGVRDIEGLKTTLLARNAGGTPFGTAAIFLGHHRQGRTNLRRPLAQSDHAPHQWPEVFLSRL